MSHCKWKLHKFEKVEPSHGGSSKGAVMGAVCRATKRCSAPTARAMQTEEVAETAVTRKRKVQHIAADVARLDMSGETVRIKVDTTATKGVLRCCSSAAVKL